MHALQIQDRERRDAIDEWELRAIREKQLARDQWDLYWQFQQWDRMDMLNHPPNEQRDVRYIAKLYVPSPSHLASQFPLPVTAERTYECLNWGLLTEQQSCFGKSRFERDFVPEAQQQQYVMFKSCSV